MGGRFLPEKWSPGKWHLAKSSPWGNGLETAQIAGQRERERFTSLVGQLSLCPINFHHRRVTTAGSRGVVVWWAFFASPWTCALREPFCLTTEALKNSTTFWGRGKKKESERVVMREQKNHFYDDDGSGSNEERRSPTRPTTEQQSSLDMYILHR